MSTLNPLSFIAVSAAVLLSAAPAAAHARLVSATPAAKSAVASPRVVTLTFSDRVAPAFSSFDVVNAAGAKATVRSQVSQDGKTITGILARPLAAGAYVVNWRIASTDGHRMTGSYDFTVR
ncbi:Copper resistance protein C precursor [Brevundimonas diminuta]|jgi:methionine-rich copper-binding protein CopC|uniref:copper homeostasis periplasmic binding protein CopC n=1 Tax=Brevundimonas diminuta TaxID=293 RepID=UPI000207F6F2|nr:copper homeostasis periplasmic binding protein CopC [Brevundimonas diminuta]EGF94603.1 copper resistance protein C [Brevundimonas diminuta ATCC 11568]OWR21705.1 copper resistance protein CopC [Brevundimonas diminuta]WQE46622.1 copper homeostasis periplasmic binding protein CopC [Brevundimonas diminuta]SPU47919.1 Copper resistance protein C precursor [Brevundimonas diminuta]SUW15877.1 Copper resistance protein C precursor [Brevundimonas diminuta]